MSANNPCVEPPSVLYITYDGLLEPLGQSQVLAYQERLASAWKVHLLSFEKTEDWEQHRLRDGVALRTSASGMSWHPLRYHKRPSALATAYDILAGTLIGLWLIWRNNIRIVHARSYVAAVMVLSLRKLTGVRFVFDMRGFWADERVDGGLWVRGERLYRVAKWFERQFLLNADHVVSLTHAAVREMEKLPYLVGGMPPVTVIPTCADLDLFCPQPSIQKEFLLGYVGSAGTWYEFDATVACFAELLRMKPHARILIINRNEHEYIQERLSAGGVPLAAVELRAASHAEIPQQIARMQASIFFIKPVFSKQASAPTKLAELLGCGVPCLSNSGVGDMAEILEGERVGVSVSDFTPASLGNGLIRLLDLMQEPDIESRCVSSAHRHFSLEEGVARYDQVYRSLLECGVSA